MNSIEYAILIKKKTRLESLTTRFNTKAQSKFYIESSGGDFLQYEEEDEQFHYVFAEIQRRLSKVLKNKVIEHDFLPSFLFNDKQLIIVVGQDGLVANTAKYVNGLPIIAVNPDINRYDGVLLPFNADNFMYAVELVMSGRFNFKIANLAEARLNTHQRLLAFNDLFIGAASHISARYRISYNKYTENHSSSGVIVSTPAGATGWLSSVFNMSMGIQNFIEQKTAKKSKSAPNRVIKTLADNELMFAVREPFLSKQSSVNLVAGILTENQPLIIESFMPNNGVIFSDGIESDFLQFNSGTIATIGIAPEKAVLVSF